jgi:hypothetical protein
MSTTFFHRVRTLPLWLFAAAMFASAQQPALRVADFDGDGRSDYAVSQLQDRINGAYRYRVDIALTGGVDSSFLVSSTQARFGLLVAAVDVDGDQDLDLVIRSAFDLRLIGVWINNGHGAFSEGNKTSYTASLGLQHNEVLEPHHSRRTAAELPRIGGSSSFLQPVDERLSIPQTFNARAALFAAPSPLPDCTSSPLRGPPSSLHHNS